MHLLELEKQKQLLVDKEMKKEEKEQILVVEDIEKEDSLIMDDELLNYNEAGDAGKQEKRDDVEPFRMHKFMSQYAHLTSFLDCNINVIFYRYWSFKFI